jgi:hypothetical protein
MATFTQAILLGADRLNAAPAVPHVALSEAWALLDWSSAKDTALLDACALLGTARAAGTTLPETFAPIASSASENRPLAPSRAVAVLRRLLAEEARPLLSEWLGLCAQREMLVPPFFLRRLFDVVIGGDDRALLGKVIGERGRWLARQNPEWSWVGTELAPPTPELWETGSDDERLAALRALRSSDPARARALVDATWAVDAPEFRFRTLEVLRTGLSLADEALLTRALADRRKDTRAAAQALLATIPDSGLAQRMRTRAEVLVRVHSGLLGKKIEVNPPAAFDPSWRSDAIDEKPPVGIGEKAFWTQQILSTVPLSYWMEKLGVDARELVALAVKSGDWAELLLNSWFRAATIHREADACAALLEPLLDGAKNAPPAAHIQAVVPPLLAVCTPAERWRLVSARPEIVWIALPFLAAAPSLGDGGRLLDALAATLRDGFNPGGSPAAVAAARHVPPELRNEAARLLTRESGLSKPAEAFLQALELRAEIQAAFSSPPST